MAISRTAKIIIISITSVVLLITVIVGIGIYVGAKYSKELLGNSKAALLEGTEFGKQTDNNGCVKEAILRHKKAPGFQAAIANNLFLRGCLETSQPSEGFCDNVPPANEIMKSVQWQLQKCKEADIPNNYGAQLFGQIQQYCHSTQNRNPK